MTPNSLQTTADRFTKNLDKAWLAHPPPCQEEPGILPCDQDPANCPLNYCPKTCTHRKAIAKNITTRNNQVSESLDSSISRPATAVVFQDHD